MGFSRGESCGYSAQKSVTIQNINHANYIMGNIPTYEIDYAIDMHHETISQLEFKIYSLERIKKDRQRSKDWREKMNAIAQEFFDPDATHLDINTRKAIIMQRLGCTPNRAYVIAKSVTALAKRESRKRRNELICFKARMGENVTTIAREHDLSRQQVHNVIKDHQKWLK